MKFESQIKLSGLGANAWDYSEQGLDWAEDGLGSCSGSRQSPIDIIRDQTILYTGPDFDSFEFSTNYCADIEGVFKNDGHTLKFEATDGNTVANYMTGGPLGTTKYYFWQFHFHWGSGVCGGSEHWVDGQQ